MLTHTHISDAYAFAATKHRHQTDKAGQPYIYHCHAVAMAVRPLGPGYEIVGVLHDVVEDTDATLDEIEALFGFLVREGVDAMTIRKGEDYFTDYFSRIEANEIARAVKLADARHNYERCSQLSDEKKRKVLEAKYVQVIARLSGS